MSNSDSDAELPEIVDDGTNNNYSEWKTRSYHKLVDWNLLKYIEGLSSQPPIIPPLVVSETVILHDLDDNGHCTTVHDVHVPGNLAEHEQAVRDAESWMTGNNTALARIVSDSSVPFRATNFTSWNMPSMLNKHGTACTPRTDCETHSMRRQ